MSDITLLRPGFLWLALLVIPLVFLTARRLVGLAPWRRRTAILLQTLSALLLLVTLAEPALVKADQAFSLVVVLDSSASVSSQGRQQAAAYAQGVIAKADPANHTYFVAAATQARLLSNDEIASGSWLTETIQNPKSGYPMGDQNTQTDLAAGLNLADSLLPNAGKRRVVLVSDGWQTHGDAAAEASRMAARGVDVQVVGLSALGSPEVILKSLDIASYARVGDTVVSELRIYSTTETSATVNLKVDGKPFTDGRINLDPGDNRITIEQQVEAPGFHRLDATLESSSDTSAENNAASATLVVKQQPTVLVLEDRPGEADQIAKALTDRQITVEVQEPSVIPAQWAELDRYDAVVLNNVAATSFTLDQQRTLQEYVRKGGHGLITVGGQTSYAKGGYPDSVLEDILPVSSRPGPRPEQGETALILVMDRSQSMDEWMGMSREDTKFSMAKEAARLAVDSLRKDDTLGVLAFDTDNSWAVPVQKIADSTDQENIKSLITNIPLGGGTHIFPALQDAANAMRAVQANSKHIVLLTDGKDFHSETYDFVLNQLRSDNVSLSTIGVGDDADRDLLTRLAKEGQGRYYFTERIDNIPKIVFKELDLALKQSVIEGTIQPHIDAPSPLLRGFAPQDIPQLGGYDLTTPKEDSIVGLTSDLGHPLLAHWNYGLGRVIGPVGAWSLGLTRHSGASRSGRISSDGKGSGL